MYTFLFTTFSTTMYNKEKLNTKNSSTSTHRIFRSLILFLHFSFHTLLAFCVFARLHPKICMLFCDLKFILISLSYASLQCINTLSYFVMVPLLYDYDNMVLLYAHLPWCVVAHRLLFEYVVQMRHFCVMFMFICFCKFCAAVSLADYITCMHNFISIANVFEAIFLLNILNANI